MLPFLDAVDVVGAYAWPVKCEKPGQAYARYQNDSNIISQRLHQVKDSGS